MWHLYIITILLSFLLTYFIRRIALKKNIVDIPNERSSHKTTTPRGGGLAIIISYFIGLIYLFYQNLIDTNLFYALLSGSIIAIVSLLDDIKDLKPSIRIIAQSISAICALYFIGGFKSQYGNLYAVIFWIINCIVFIAFIWFINLYNFLDGIDAYASLEAILVSLGILLFTGNPIFVVIILAVSGFLIWNWPKAKIFMGDVGSTQLGFILVVLGIYFHNTSEFGIINWIVLTSLFWFDASLTIFRRWINKEQLSIAHKKHAYQRLHQSGFSHLKIDILAIIINFVLIAFIWFNHIYIHQEIISLIFSVCLMIGINWWIDKRMPFAKNQ
jgi:Fuc2NAc and GlcNAc transferase